MTSTNCTLKEVDFYEEHRYIVSLGLARTPRDVNTKRFYRLTAIPVLAFRLDMCTHFAYTWGQ